MSYRNNNDNNNDRRMGDLFQQRRAAKGRNNNSRRRTPQYSHLPLEQGVVCSLKDSFGFIHCADRPEEIFFHYSQVLNNNSNNNNRAVDNNNDLQLDTPVEFRVGPSQKDATKLAALQVRVLEEPIVWETVEAEHARGLVEKRVHPRDNLGSIRVLVEKKKDHNDGKQQKSSSSSSTAPNNEEPPSETADGPLVKFGPDDYNPPPPEPTSRFERPPTRRPRLAKGDLVEFTLVRERRTGDFMARSIQLLLSEKERARQAQEQALLAAATVEQGVITSLKGEYGFLRSNKRREEVYFHYSSIELEERNDDEEHSDMVLKEGQDMKFLVVTEEEASERGGGRLQRRVSARQVKMEPRGSVKFHDVLATGVTGTVSMAPQPQDSGHALDLQGKVVLTTALKDGDGMDVTEVYLSAKDSPGGSFAFRGGSSVGLWIEAGDCLLFDVVQDFADGACRAVPTRHYAPRENPMDLVNDTNGENDDDEDQAIRLMSLSLASRSEGTVNALKESYGFIHFAERPVDAHFKLFQMLPDVLQQDLRRNMGLADVDSRGHELKLTVGAEVQYDMSVHGSIQSHSSRPSRGSRAPQERENLKAQRVLLLPPGTIRQVIPMAKGVRGRISKGNPKQPFAGTVDLDEAIQPVAPEVRHPLVARMIDEYLASDRDLPLVYHDVQSAKEDGTVIDMIERRGQGRLSWTHIPQSGQSSYAGRLCIRKEKAIPSKGEEEGSATQVDVVSPNESKPSTEAQEPPNGAIEGSDLEQSVKKESATESSERAEDVETVEEETTNETEESVQEEKSDGKDESDEKDTKRAPRNRQQKALRPIKTIRFDKSHISKELKGDIPPGVGDIVEFDVCLSRRTGQCYLESMRMIERRAPEFESTELSGFGIVKEVVAARRFGFISVIDECEILFFALSSVDTPDGDPDEATKVTSFGSGAIRKGDEVKFDIGTEKGGKRVALNVTVLPKGTLPNTAEKNACQGFVLMEPSHTSLKNTPIRHAKSTASQASDKSGRWDSVDQDRKKLVSAEPITEQGCILLLSDPSGLFRSATKVDSERSSSDRDSSERSSIEPDKENEKTESTTESDGITESASSVPTFRHLRYKNGAIAVHGKGSASATDASSKPRRGDLVSFVKTKKGGSGLRDIRIVERAAVSPLRGRLEDIDVENSMAKFIASTEQEETFEVSLSEVVSCDPGVLKENESVEGILHEGSIYGVCRTADLYLESKVTANRKERPKLNLTVKKDRGGKIMAQSMMAKGPNKDSDGFAPGWTTRMSAYATSFVPTTTSEEDVDEEQVDTGDTASSEINLGP